METFTKEEKLPGLEGKGGGGGRKEAVFWDLKDISATLTCKNLSTESRGHSTTQNHKDAHPLNPYSSSEK